MRTNNIASELASICTAVCEAISALEHGNSGYKGSPQRRRNRLVQVPLDLEDKDPEDPDQLEEELEPTRPSMVENAATPKLVKGLNFKGEKGAKDFKELTEKLKARAEESGFGTEEAMQRVHRHTKALEKKRRERIAAKKKAAQKLKDADNA